MPKTFEQARAENELVTGTPGAGQTQITGDEVVGAWLTGAIDAGWKFSNLKQWIKLDSDWMSRATYDSNSNDIVDNAEQLADGTNTVTAAQARTHIDDATIHFVINDGSTSASVAWSGSFINTSLNSKENNLNNPTSNGQILSSTTLGARSWVDDKVVPSGGTEDQIIVKQSATEQDAAWTNIPLAFASSWKFDNDTTATDPGNESFKLNAATQAATTAVYLSYTNVNGLNLKDLLLQLPEGEQFAIWEQNDSDRAVLYEISGAITDNTTWCTIPVTFKNRASLEFRNGRTCNFQFFGLGASGIEEAPIDNRSYFRFNESWTTILRGYGEAVDARGNESGAITYNADTYNRYTSTINASITGLTLSTTMTSTSMVLNWTVSGTNAHDLSAVNWGTNGVPPMTSGKRYRIALFTEDTGTTWDGVWNEY